MHLISLKLQNFKQYKDLSLDFPNGLVTITGQNGIGKSNLISAIAWLLYGSIAIQEQKDSIRYRYAPDNEGVSGELVFKIGKEQYTLRRSLSASLKADAELLVNGLPLTRKTDSTSEHVQKLLGMDWRIFYTSVFARQKEINVLSSLRPAERRDIMIRMLDLDKLDIAVNTARSDLKSVKKELDSISIQVSGMNVNTLNTDIDQYTYANEQWLNHIGLLNKEMMLLNENMQQLLNTKSQKQQDKENEIANEDIMVANLQTQINDSNVKIASHNTTVSSCAKQIDTIQRLGKDGTCPTCTNKLGDDYQNILEKLQKEYRKSIEQLTIIQKERDKIAVEFNNTSNKRLKLQTELDVIIQSEQNNRSSMGQQIHDLQVKINEAYQTQQKIALQLRDYTNIYTNYQQNYQKQVELTGSHVSLGKIEKVLVDFRAYMISRVCPMLSQYASTLLSKLSGGKYTQLRLTDDYDIMIISDGVEYPISHFSGGEEDLFNICLRLAISRTIINRSHSMIEFLFLDEITSALDADRISAVISMLEDYASSVGQIFLITHQLQVSDMIPNRISIMDSTDGSVVTIV